MSFSGGGTRAAVFSYGVLSELRNTQINSSADNRTLLHEVDYISSVSGGSFTAAYYGLFGDRIFDDYETIFLRRNIQKTLINSMFNPINWFRLLSARFDRGNLAVEYYDKQIFQGKTFGDMTNRNGPFIQINATDLGTGQPFWFTNDSFALLCSDLYDFKVASAVAASSAVPVVVPPITLKNYSGCRKTGQSLIDSFGDSTDDIRMQALQKSLSSFSNKDQRKYIHLVDGGIADNLGIRSMFYRIQLLNKTSKKLKSIKTNVHKKPNTFVIIVVNAETNKIWPMEQSPDSPSSVQVISAVSAAQISRYNMETISQSKKLFNDVAKKYSSDENEVNTYFIELKFDDLPDLKMRNITNNMATSLSLPDDQVDMLYEAGRTLLRESKDFQRLLQNLRSVRQ